MKSAFPPFDPAVYGPDAIIMKGINGAELAPAGLPGARRLRRAEEDPRREDHARPGDRRAQEVGAPRPRRRGLPDRPQVELHAQELPRAEVHGVQLRRGRAGDVQGPRHPALQPAHRHRGHGDRGLRHRLDRRLQLHPRRDLGRLRAVRGGAEGGVRRGPPREEHPRARASTSTSTRTTAGARTSAARRRRSSSRSKGRRACRGSSRRSRRATACTASRPRSTTPRRSPRCPGSSSTAATKYLELGRPNNGGTKLFSVSGDVEHPGNYEVRLGLPFAKLLEMAGGMRGGRKLKACIPGGSSMPVLPGDDDDADRHGLRLDRQGGVDARVGRGDRHGRYPLHGALPRAAVVLLLRGVVRPVHAVPRGHRLAVPHGAPDRDRPRPHGGPRRPRQRRGQHRRPHDLRARRRGGAAGEELHPALPRRVRAPHPPQALPGRSGRGGRRGWQHDARWSRSRSTAGRSRCPPARW